MSGSMELALQNVADATRLRREAQAEADAIIGSVHDDWKAAIRAALAAGATRTAIAAEAGISRQRVVQIEEGRNK